LKTTGAPLIAARFLVTPLKEVRMMLFGLLKRLDSRREIRLEHEKTVVVQ
jgi:hypothetical protein